MEGELVSFLMQMDSHLNFATKKISANSKKGKKKFILTQGYFFIAFSERKGERRRNINVRERVDHLPCTLTPITFWCIENTPTNWATQPGPKTKFYMFTTHSDQYITGCEKANHNLKQLWLNRKQKYKVQLVNKNHGKPGRLTQCSWEDGQEGVSGPRAAAAVVKN